MYTLLWVFERLLANVGRVWSSRSYNGSFYHPSFLGTQHVDRVVGLPTEGS